VPLPEEEQRTKRRFLVHDLSVIDALTRPF
jgi:hypothetical protein